MIRALRDGLFGAALLGAMAAAASCGAEDPGTAVDNVDETQPRLDRMGRVEVTNFMLCFRPFCRDEGIKDGYNREDPFAVVDGERYRKAFQTGLERLDGFDKALGSKDGDWAKPHPLLGVIEGDYLVVDVSKPCTVDTPSYLEIEMAAYRGVSHETCGGRTPNDDVIDTTLTLLINGPDRAEPHRGDGVNEPAELATDTFPYFAAPHSIF